MEPAATEYQPHPLVRNKVKEMLLSSPAFLSLPRDKQMEVANATVRVADYIVQAGGATRDTPMAVAMAGNPPPPGQPPATPPPTLTQEGVQDFGNLVKTVDFPKFVSGLIEGVFTSIVGSSIKQMQAYAELVKNVAKSVDEYMKDNVSENNARDYLADRYPDYLQVDISGEKPQLKPKEGADDQNMPDFFKDLGLTQPVTSLDEDTAEQTLVPAARQRIAMDRQQLLATMVLMGINRLVVTDGQIQASVTFHVDTEQTRHRTGTRTSDFNYTYNRTQDSGYDASYDGSYKSDNYNADYKDAWYSHDSTNTTANFKVSTVQTTDNTDSIKMHADLTGKVNVHFKSDYFPLDKVANNMQMDMIRQKSQAAAAQGAQPAQPGAAPPAAPPPAAPPPAAPPPATPAPAGH